MDTEECNNFDYSEEAQDYPIIRGTTSSNGWDENNLPDAPLDEIAWRNQEEMWDAIMDGEFVPEDW